MNKGVTGPLLITALVVAVGNGWILAAWNHIYNASHGLGGTGAGTPTTKQPAPTATSGLGGAIPPITKPVFNLSNGLP